MVFLGEGRARAPLVVDVAKDMVWEEDEEWRRVRLEREWRRMTLDV
jgi:hypothetical protein